MPTSNLAIAIDALNMIEQVPHTGILDIGPGHGKYGLLIREYLTDKPIRMDCIEAEPTYLVKFHWLKCLYDNILLGGGAELTEEAFDVYDVVILFDVIEHIEKEKALAMLERIRGRVMITTPEDFFEQHVEGVPSEDHISHWTTAEFQAMPRCEVAYENIGGVIVRLGPRQ